MPIKRIRGDTYPDQFLITTTTNGQPANLSGCTFKMTLSPTSAPDASTPPVYTLTGVVADPTTGIVEFAPSETQANQVGEFFFDIEMHDVLGRIRTILIDTYSYSQDITK
jgi:hypothetical protein